MTIALTIGGTLIDVDGDTKLGLVWDSGLFADNGIKLSRSFGLSIPCTPNNDKAMDMSYTQDFEGVRQSAQCTIVAGGVALNGRVYLQETDGRRYELLFVYGDLAGAASGMLTDKIPGYLVGILDTIQLTGSKTDVTFGGAIPGFGFYAYHNGAAQTGAAVTTNNQAGMFPSVNLAYMIFAAAQACGYSVVFPANHPQDANHFGLVLPTMNTYAETVCRVTGSPRNNYTDVNSNLTAAGLTIATRRYKRGRYNANVTAFVLQATKSLTVKYIATDAGTNTNNVFAKGQGYDLPQSWIDEHQILDYSVSEFHLNAGEWFAIANWSDMHTSEARHYWKLATGYETAIDCTFKVLDDAGTVNVGEQISLSDNLPDMSLAELCQAYCGLCDLLLSVDEENKVLTFTPLAQILAGSVALDLDALKHNDVTAITRYIDGFARHNYVRCNSAEYVTEECRFLRDYPCDNDSLPDERDIVTVPFNEGNWEISNSGAKEAVFNDVEVGDNGSVQYRGCLSVFYEAPANCYALHVQTINDLGVGLEMAEGSRNAMQCRVTARIPFHKFAALRPGHIALLHGRLWTVKSAVWSGEAADLELIYLKS